MFFSTSSRRPAKRRPRSCFTSTRRAWVCAGSTLTKWPRPRSPRLSITRARTSIRCSARSRKSNQPVSSRGGSMSMLSKNLEKSLHRAFALAGERRHEYATLEHLLLAMTEDEDATPVLKACGVDIDRLRHDLESFIDNRLKGIVTQTPSEPLPTAGFQRVVQRAAVHVQSSGRKEVTGANVLVALFSERDSHA